MSTKGIVFNLQKMSIHDGPGIRTTVFFKGCPMRCLWCSNPESQSQKLEIACFETRCISCGYCAEVCPEQIIEKDGAFGITDRESCDLCMRCVDECCTGGKKLIGETYDEETLYQEILKDKSFYDSSGGGVTFSGGEPFMQAEFLIGMLKRCKEGGVHTAIETTGVTKTELLLLAAEYLDLIYFDVKHMDDEIHREVTGVSNKIILENLASLAKVHSNITVRIPVVPGINDNVENICRTAAYAAELGISCLELLPYHNLGEVKYSQLGREYALSDVKKPGAEYMSELAESATKAIGEKQTSVSVMKSL
ncbi:MAG: glycyl-radical enzyme activating protein [Emergencia sp.]